ncbi:hypothetical protein [Rossellomorea aquimaris]|uniref:Lipoprotein n=1 Tax=Rossellomorea aquimaris TaxID=189382 RepID=A0A1J6W116_9BACI|nr:hypothetical protein [Rossellomorea aquimaris]OIU71822.1 hypothetical protein BHE18_03975 [Rossellomorea aquimaris]
MRKLALCILTMLIMSACSIGKEKEYELCGYGPMMVADGKEYLRIDSKKRVILGDELGKIKNQINEEYHPVDNFTSNTLAKGSIIFRVKGQDQYLVAKTKDEKYVLFELLNKE